MVELLNKKVFEENFESILLLPENQSRQGEGGLRTKGILKQSSINEPLISIITAVYNGEKHLEETIQSIVNQTYKNMEYIIIDGGSTDKTLDIIKKYDDKIDYWVSEKDRGISDAFNKGVRLAQGIYLNFQGDGDGFIANDSLEKVFQDIDSDKDIFVSAKIKRVDVSGNEIFISKQPKLFDKRSLLFRMSIPHQGLFTHINYFKKYGLFDATNIFSMDYEHLLRSYKEFPRVILRDVIVAQWRADGLGNGRFLEIFQEYDKIKRDHKIANRFILSLMNSWILLKYFIKRIINL